MVEAINQGECTDCGESEDNYTQMDRTFHDQPEDDEEVWDGIEREVKCDCGETATVTITETGVSTTGPISLDDASWNGDSDESPDSE